MGCSQSVETEEDRRQKKRQKTLKYLDDLKKEEEKQAASDAKAVAKCMKTRDKADPYPHEASRAADLAAQTAGIIAAREARRQQEAQRKLAKTRVGKGMTEPNYWDLMGQIR